ncbi:hypothetical protein [Streptomyces sp. DSM 118878]
MCAVSREAIRTAVDDLLLKRRTATGTPAPADCRPPGHPRQSHRLLRAADLSLVTRAAALARARRPGAPLRAAKDGQASDLEAINELTDAYQRVFRALARNTPVLTYGTASSGVRSTV